MSRIRDEPLTMYFVSNAGTLDLTSEGFLAIQARQGNSMSNSVSMPGQDLTSATALADNQTKAASVQEVSTAPTYCALDGAAETRP